MLILLPVFPFIIREGFRLYFVAQNPASLFQIIRGLVHVVEVRRAARSIYLDWGPTSECTVSASCQAYGFNILTTSAVTFLDS